MDRPDLAEIAELGGGKRSLSRGQACDREASAGRQDAKRETGSTRERSESHPARYPTAAVSGLRASGTSGFGTSAGGLRRPPSMRWNESR